MAGMGHSLHQRTVIGEQQQSLAVFIQPAHGKYPRTAVCHQFSGCGAAQLIAESGHIAAGLIEHQINGRLRKCDGRPVNGDHISIGIGLVTQVRRNAVDRYPPRRQQRFRRPAGADAGPGDQFLQPFPHAVSSVFSSFRAAKPISYSDL